MSEVEVSAVPLDKNKEVTKNTLKVSANESGKRNIFTLDNFSSNSSKDVYLVLLGMGMEKYNNLFMKAKITLDTFLQLDEADLFEIGITDINDREIIMKNLKIYEAKPKKLLVPKNSLHDLKIARNIKNELVFLQNYCSYLELQMRKYKLTDYRLSWKESASTYLKAFAETALVQSKILSQRVFHDRGDNHLIGKALKVNNLILTKDLKEKLMEGKSKGRKKKSLYGATILGFLSLAVVIKYFYKWN